MTRKIEHRTDCIDPVLSMLGAGKELWLAEAGDDFVERLRAQDAEPPPLPRLIPK